MIPMEMPRLYGLMTSSSHLTSLQLSGVQLPAACGKLLVAEGQVLPHLFTLKLRGKPQHWWDNGHYCADGAPLGPGDVDRLVKCCPSLDELDVAGSVQCGVDMSGLRHLQHLTSLVVGGESVDDGCAEGLAQVAGLEALTVIDPAKFKEHPEDRDHYNKSRYYAYYDRKWYIDNYGRDSDTREASYFTFEGLYSLMRLKQLRVVGISRNTCLFTGARLSNGNDCKEMEEFLGWNDYELQSLLDSNCKWQAFKKRKDREEELAGELLNALYQHGCSCMAPTLMSLA